MKKQLLVGMIHELTMGGAERMMVNIVNHFASQGESVHLIVFKNIGTLKELLHNDVVVHDLEASSVKKSMPKALKILYEIEPTIVFTGIGHLNIALAPFIPFMKKIFPHTRWVSRETNIVSMQNQSSKYPKFFNWLYRNIYNAYDTIITQSKDMQNDLKEHYPKAFKKSLVINNPIDIKKLEKLAKEPLNDTFDTQAINLIIVGTLTPRKRHSLLLESLNKLPENYRLTIVGSGGEELALKALTKKLNLENRVSFEGHQTNPYPYVVRSDLFLLASEHEGFPNVLLEANALGVPVVAFACPGGITEIIEEGINGFTVPNGDIEALIFTIQRAINYDFSREKIINSMEKRYSHDIIFEKYKKVFYD